MKEPCPKCGANRTQFEGQTSWECGSYSMYVPGLNPFWAHAESEHCKCRQRVKQLEEKMRPDETIADWVINELCDELECDGDEIVNRVKSLKQTLVKMSEAAGELHRRVQELEEGIERVLPDLNCKMLTPYYNNLKSILRTQPRPPAPC